MPLKFAVSRICTVDSLQTSTDVRTNNLHQLLLYVCTACEIKEMFKHELHPIYTYSIC